MRRRFFPWAEVLKLRGVVITTRTERHTLEARNATEEPNQHMHISLQSARIQFNNLPGGAPAHRPNTKMNKVIGVNSTTE